MDPTNYGRVSEPDRASFLCLPGNFSTSITRASAIAMQSQRRLRPPDTVFRIMYIMLQRGLPSRTQPVQSWPQAAPL